MKTINSTLTALAVVAAAFSAGAQSTSPVTYFEDFSKLGQNGDPLPSEWVTYGVGEVPMPEWQDVFGNDGKAPYYRLMNINGYWGAFSNSSFIEDVESDEWLVTPKIHINYDEEIIMLTVGAYGKAGSSALNEFSVFVSETGNTKEDFDRAPAGQSYIYGKISKLNTKRVAIPLRGYAGKDVYLAFVNRSKDSALCGLTELSIARYYVSATDHTLRVLPEGSKTNISLTVDINTPYEIDGFNVSLSTSTGVKSEVKIDRPVNIVGKTFNITFPEEIVVPKEGVTYTVTIDPGIEGTDAFEMKGIISTPSRTYTPVAVIEELTGTWCGFCPRGAAYLDYYTSKYNSDKGRAIGIAVHYNDLMEISGREYLTTLQNRMGTTSFPMAYFQRTIQNDPGTPRAVEIIMETPSYSKVSIDKVDFHPETERKMTVDFSVENAYDMEALDQRVVFVVIENDVKPSGDNLEGWSQANQYSGITQTAIEQAYGDELWPFFQPYCEAPNPIPYQDITYQHVARGIFPEFDGILLNASCKAEEKVAFQTTFDCPTIVDKDENVAVVALLIDDKNKRIITADEMPYALFNGSNGIEAVAEDGNISIVNANGMLSVKAHEAMAVELVGIDGMAKARYESGDGTLSVPAADFSGIMIVKVTTANGVAVKKIAF